MIITIFHVISTTLKACLGVLPVLLILGLREYSRKCYTTLAGVLPQKCCSASGSTLVLKKHSVGPFLREYSRKSGIVLPGVLPKRLFLYTGSDLDMIVLQVLLFLVSGSTHGRLIFCQWEYSRKSGIVLPGVLPKKLFLYTGSTPGRLIFCQWEYSCKSGIVLPGVLPKMHVQLMERGARRSARDDIWGAIF